MTTHPYKKTVNGVEEDRHILKMPVKLQLEGSTEIKDFEVSSLDPIFHAFIKTLAQGQKFGFTSIVEVRNGWDNNKFSDYVAVPATTTL